MATKAKANVIDFRPRRDFAGEEELPVGLPPVALSRPQAAKVTGIDLAGKAKVWFAIGPGRSGKTTLLRWAAEQSVERGGVPIVAAADPQNRSLKNYLADVAEPPTNDALATSRWLEALLRHAMEEKVSALIDLAESRPTGFTISPPTAAGSILASQKILTDDTAAFCSATPLMAGQRQDRMAG